MSGPVKRIVIADDHEAIRKGVREVIERADRQVVAQAADGAAALTMLIDERPDLAILDQSLPLLNGLQVVERARSQLPDCRFLIYTMHDRHQLRAEAELVGVHGLVFKSDPIARLRSAVEALLVGRTYFSASFNGDDENAEDGHAAPASFHKPGITPREAQVLKLIAEGFTNREAADHLGISVKTIETHRASLQVKVGAHNTASLVRYAIRNGFVEA